MGGYRWCWATSHSWARWCVLNNINALADREMKCWIIPWNLPFMFQACKAYPFDLRALCPAACHQYHHPFPHCHLIIVIFQKTKWEWTSAHCVADNLTGLSCFLSNIDGPYKLSKTTKESSKQEYGTDSYNRPGRGVSAIGPSRAGWPGSALNKQSSPASVVV